MNFKNKNKVHVVKFDNNGAVDYVRLRCSNTQQAREIFISNCKDPILQIKTIKA